MAAVALCFAAAVAQSTVSHIVERGENLETIAARYGVTPAQIIALNPDAKDFIYIGMELKVPAKSSAAPSYSTSPASTPGYVPYTPVEEDPAPASGYGTPASGYGTPASGYGTPASGYGIPASGYGSAPYSGYSTAPGTPTPQHTAASDYDLIRMYKGEMSNCSVRSRNCKIAAWSVGLTCIVGGAIVFLAVNSDSSEGPIIGGSLAGFGVIWTTSWLIAAHHQKKKCDDFYSFTPLLEQEILNVKGNTRLRAGVDVFNNSFTHDRGLGLGFRLNF